MFVGAINATLRKFLTANAHLFENQVVVMGCSGNFSVERTLHVATKARVYSNDVSLYSCALGRLFSGDPMTLDVVDDFAWMRPTWTDEWAQVASILVLLDVLQYEKCNNAHQQRMWGGAKAQFPRMVAETAERLRRVAPRVEGFFGGDVWEHFKRLDDTLDDPIYMCFAPTYSGGYERMYKRLHQIFVWDAPTYEMLDDERREGLLRWMSSRRFLWYDDRLLPGREPILKQRRGAMRTVYLYSNVVERPAYFADVRSRQWPRVRLADGGMVISAESKLWVEPMKTSSIAALKDAFLGKKIAHSAGTWGFVVLCDGVAVGCFEMSPMNFGRAGVYLLSDFAVPHTRYKRLSKLVVMVAVSAETRRLIERASERRQTEVTTTAFTDRPVSMKYRGVMKLIKRGEDAATGQKFLNYNAPFTELGWAETLKLWLKKHGSKVYSTN